MHGLLHYGHRLPRERTLEAEEPRVPPGKDSNQCLRDRGEDPVGARRREDEDDVGRGSKEMKREGWRRDDGAERTEVMEERGKMMEKMKDGGGKREDRDNEGRERQSEEQDERTEVMGRRGKTGMMLTQRTEIMYDEWRGYDV